MTDRKPDRVLDAGALKALAHPLRVRIYNLLGERGPQTASTLAALIGETSGATSYHLRALASHDLIHEVVGRGTGRERWWELPKGSVDLPGPDEMPTPASRAASQVVMSEFFRLRNDSLMEYLNRPKADQPAEWRDLGLVLTARLDLTPEQMASVRDQLQEVLDSAAERFHGQEDMPGTRRVSMRAEIFDLVDGPDRHHSAQEES
ncbi:helix-turn-helix domain-containing protein [Microbacterium sp. ARD32]|uniref:ArsR/SmtB family transcription factor n=1 Tax=Microbacterium sp. ARD32 TaxID=2962577 RepID=UPI002881ADAE|nr:helix-turn-helix domain-containing protein [Microbacterium sp. ARD32]MDT0157460.1 helix-turn-helix domain-containing protein [Microbacterium sp. ARD32]